MSDAFDSLNRDGQFPLGAAVTIDDLQDQPYATLERLRADEPVSWIPALGAWFVTERTLAVEAMRDAETFTVDDPRFSTGAVLGESMLSLDGPEHSRHRKAFANHFKPAVVREQFEVWLAEHAAAVVGGLAPQGAAELRTTLAGPFAVDTITRFLGLTNVHAADVLRWYGEISDAIVGVALGQPVPASSGLVIDELRERVAATLSAGSSPFLETLRAEAVLEPEEMVTASAVVMFGAIETSEGMTANLLWHLLTHPATLAEVRDDRTKLSAAMEESLRLEPAAAVVDRYATCDKVFGGAEIRKGDMVTISLLGANRDPAVFSNPHEFDIERENLRQHVTFVQGPHGCIGLHLARLETVTLVDAVLDGLPNLHVDRRQSTAPVGLIFRKPAAVAAAWDRG